MDDTLGIPIITDGDWLSCGDPAFLARRTTLVQSEIRNVRRELEALIGQRMLGESYTAWRLSSKIDDLQRYEQDLASLLDPPSQEQQAEYIKGLILTLPQHLHREILLGLCDDLEIEFDAPAAPATYQRLQVRLTTGEKQLLVWHADQAQMTLSAFLKTRLEGFDFPHQELETLPAMSADKLTEKVILRAGSHLARDIRLVARAHNMTISSAIRVALVPYLQKTYTLPGELSSAELGDIEIAYRRNASAK